VQHRRLRVLGDAGADVDDRRSGSGLLQGGKRGVDHPDGGQEVDVNRVLPLMVRDRRRAAQVDPRGAGRVDDDVEPAERLHGLLDDLPRPGF